MDQRLTPEELLKRRKERTRPIVCVYSGCFAKIPFPALPDIVGMMGFEGVDLTVMQGGHVDPSKYMVQLDRAFQVFLDAGLEVPMVTTNFISASQPFAYAILYVSGQLGAKFCRMGAWPPPIAGEANGQNAALRAVMMRNDLNQLATTSIRCNITSLIANHAGSYPGRSIPETEAMLGNTSRFAIGYCFDPAQAVMESGAANGWESELQAALPRLGAVSLSDVALQPQPKLCPLGEGVIDWKKFFSMLAAARFRGPISLRMDYEPRNPAAALTKDLAFTKALVSEVFS